jgi:hypothetical protein
LLELYAAARTGWRKTSAHQHEGKEAGAPIIFKMTGPDADI